MSVLGIQNNKACSPIIVLPAACPQNFMKQVQIYISKLVKVCTQKFWLRLATELFASNPYSNQAPT